MSIIKPFIESLELSDNASKMLQDLWDFAQHWDDVVDEGAPADEAIKLGSVIIPSNPIYIPYAIQPEIAKAHAKWEAANHYERNKVNINKSYMLRASYYDIALHIYMYEKGAGKLPEAAIHIYNCYGETLAELTEEVMSCQIR